MQFFQWKENSSIHLKRIFKWKNGILLIFSCKWNAYYAVNCEWKTFLFSLSILRYLVLTNIKILPLESNIFLLIFIFEFSIVLYKTNRWTNPLWIGIWTVIQSDWKPFNIELRPGFVHQKSKPGWSYFNRHTIMQ